MALPRLCGWVARLLAILLSLGFGLDTLEGESPHTVSWSPISTPPTPPQPAGKPNNGVSSWNICVYLLQHED